jgi:hypothetical protein
MKHRWLLGSVGGRFLAALLTMTAVLAVGGAARLRADTITFAQFNQRMVSDQDFAYANHGTSATFNSVSGGIPIFLVITQGFAPSLGEVEAAHLLLASSTTMPAIPPVPPDAFTREHFTGLANMIQIVLDTPVDGKNNFLTVRFSDAVLSGRLISSEASLKTSDSDSGNPARVSFSSDFIDFSDAIEHGFSLSFSSVNSSDGSGPLQMAANGFFKDFTASGTGTFDVDFSAPVPEPSSLLLAGFGLLSVLLVGSIRLLFPNLPLFRRLGSLTADLSR